MPKGDFKKATESIVPLRGVVRNGKLAAIIDQDGVELGMPVTSIENEVTGVIEKFAGGDPLFEVEPVSVDQRDTSGRWTLCTYRGVQYTATYGKFGFSTIAAGGYVWTYNYDAAGRLTSITRA